MYVCMYVSLSLYIYIYIYMYMFFGCFRLYLVSLCFIFVPFHFYPFSFYLVFVVRFVLIDFPFDVLMILCSNCIYFHAETRVCNH